MLDLEDLSLENQRWTFAEIINTADVNVDILSILGFLKKGNIKNGDLSHFHKCPSRLHPKRRPSLSDTQSAVLESHVLRAAGYFGAGQRGSGRLCSRPRGGPRGTPVPSDSSGRGHRVAGALFWRNERRAGEEKLTF